MGDDGLFAPTEVWTSSCLSKCKTFRRFLGLLLRTESSFSQFFSAGDVPVPSGSTLGEVRLFFLSFFAIGVAVEVSFLLSSTPLSHSTSFSSEMVLVPGCIFPVVESSPREAAFIASLSGASKKGTGSLSSMSFLGIGRAPVACKTFWSSAERLSCSLLNKFSHEQ